MASFIDTPGQAAFEKMRQVRPSQSVHGACRCARECARVYACACVRAAFPSQRRFGPQPCGALPSRGLHTRHDRSCARQASLFGADLALLVVALNTGHRQPLPPRIASLSSMRMHIHTTLVRTRARSHTRTRHARMQASRHRRSSVHAHWPRSASQQSYANNRYSVPAVASSTLLTPLGVRHSGHSDGLRCFGPGRAEQG